MSKISVSFTVTFILGLSSLANAHDPSRCPQLTESAAAKTALYSCQGSTPDFDSDNVEIGQSQTSAGAVYSLPIAISPNGDNGQKLADGLPHSTTEKVHGEDYPVTSITSCEADGSLSVWQAIGSKDGPFYVEAIFNIYVEKEDVARSRAQQILIQKTLSMPGQGSVNTESVCELKK